MTWRIEALADSELEAKERIAELDEEIKGLEQDISDLRGQIKALNAERREVQARLSAARLDVQELRRTWVESVSA